MNNTGGAIYRFMRKLHLLRASRRKIHARAIKKDGKMVIRKIRPVTQIKLDK